MSYYDYMESRKIDCGYSFETLIMAALRKADSINFQLLTDAFPQISEELQERYNAAGGKLKNEV